MIDVPLWQKPMLTIKEASSLYGIGENKLREISNPEDCSFVLYVGRKKMIKREEFDKYIKKSYSI